MKAGRDPTSTGHFFSSRAVCSGLHSVNEKQRSVLLLRDNRRPGSTGQRGFNATPLVESENASLAPPRWYLGQTCYHRYGTCINEHVVVTYACRSTLHSTSAHCTGASVGAQRLCRGHAINTVSTAVVSVDRPHVRARCANGSPNVLIYSTSQPRAKLVL
jgi:hypothetical protein